MSEKSFVRSRSFSNEKSPSRVSVFSVKRYARINSPGIYVTYLLHTHKRPQLRQRDVIALALTNLRPSDRPVIMTDHLRRQRLPCPSHHAPSPTQRHQQTGIIIPMELHNILSYHVLHFIERATLAGRQVVRQRIQPHVNSVPVCDSVSSFIRTSHRNGPRHTRQRTTHAQVLRALFD